MFCKHTYIT